MGYFERILENPTPVVLTALLLIYVIKEGYELFQWWKARADGYHKGRREKEDFAQQVSDIAATLSEHTKTLEGIKESLAEINTAMDEHEKDRKADMVAIGRAMLLSLYETLKDKDKLTFEEYKSFDDVADRYLAAGGNSVFKDKIIPEIRAKQIDDDGK